MKDAAFNEQNKPVHVPAKFADAGNLQDRVVFALAEKGEATADEVTRKLETLMPDAPNKEVIANVHHVLSGLYEKGLIAGRDSNGDLIFSLQKKTDINTDDV